MAYSEFEFRHYDASIGRFMSIDPLFQQFQAMSPFNYADNNPSTYMDLYGLQANKDANKKPINIDAPHEKIGVPDGKSSVSFKQFLGSVDLNVAFGVGNFMLSVANAGRQPVDSKSINTNVQSSIKADATRIHQNNFTPQFATGNASSVILEEAIIYDADSKFREGTQYTGFERAGQLGVNMFWAVESGAGLYKGVLSFKNLLKLGKTQKDVISVGNASKASTNLLKPLGLGSTGRTTAANLVEQMAMKDAMANPQLGTRIMEGMKDSRWLGWTKMEYKVKTAKGVNAVVHYVGKWEDGVLKAVDDFKFK